LKPKINRDKDTFFSRKESLNCNGKLLTICKPLVMGILNITPDSFFDGGKYYSDEKWLSQTKKMLSEGADIIDIGAISTRPGSKEITENEGLWQRMANIENKLSYRPDSY